MNRNTAYGLSAGTGAVQIPTLSLAATTETAFTINTAGTATTAFVVAPVSPVGSVPPLDSTINASLTGLHAGSRWEPRTASSLSPSFDLARPFKVRLSGVGNAGANAAQTAIVALYCGTSSTIGSDTKIASTGAALAMVAGGAFNFLVEAYCIWDSTLQILSGRYEASINFVTPTSQYTSPAVLLNQATVTSAAGLSFLGTIKFGNAAASTCSLTEFSIERV